MSHHTLSELAAGVPVQHWLILGPFVVKTGDHFEREYLFERDRILDIDYLEAEGGEARVQPALGQAHANPGLGPKTYAWRELHHPIVHGMRFAEPLIYETVQRNAVLYCASWIESDRDCLALLDARHSGVKIWMNGELVCNDPYGVGKGLRMGMPTQVMRLKKGRNLLLIKLRPGFICDAVEFAVHQVYVSPLTTSPDTPLALGRIRPTTYFTGTVESPRQIIEAALFNTSKVAITAQVTLASKGLQSEERDEVTCEPERVTTLRLSLPAPRESALGVTATYTAKASGGTVSASLEYCTALPPKYDGTTFVLTSFHFDTTYTQEQRVYAMGAFDIMRDYCRLHRRDPNFKSTISEIDYLKPYFDVFPEDRQTLLDAFRDNRSNADVMYNQPNEQTCDGEALVRNFLYGQLFHGRVLGQICHVYGPGDVFGHPNQLSQIARKSGCIGLTWDKHIFNFPPFFNHMSLDGTVLPHKRGGAKEDDVHAMGLSVNTGDIDQTPPTDWHASLLPKYRQATYYDLMSTIHREVEEKGAHLPMTTRDMSLYHAATAMSRINLKIGNRLGENLLLQAEMFATMANLLGAKYPEKALDKAWRQILCGQHHDSITGTHNEISYVDLMTSYREILEIGTDVLNRSLDYLGGNINVEAEKPLVVFNPLAWERTDVVRATIHPGNAKGFAIRDHAGRNVPYEVTAVHRNAKGAVASVEVSFLGENLPSLGYRAYQVVPQNKPLPMRTGGAGTVIENEFYRVEVDPSRGGGIVSLFDKEAGREVINSASGHVGNELVALKEAPDREETQHEFWTTGHRIFSQDFPARVECEQGPLGATLRARYTLAETCGVIQEISLFKGVKRVEFRTILQDYNQEDDLFCVTFPTTLKGAVPVFDERFGAVARNDSKGYLDFRTHQMIMFSDCAVYAANKWMEYGACGKLLVGKSAWNLSMIGLISPKDGQDTDAAESVMRTLIKKGITCTPWFDEGGPYWGSYQHHMDEDLLYTRFRFSIGSRGKNQYTKKLLKAQSVKVRKDFEERLKKQGYACLLVKETELSDPSWSPIPVLIVEGKTPAHLVSALDKVLGDFDDTAMIKLPSTVDATNESHTVDDYGVALLNEGTYANSIEKGGVICTMLAHTCRWYGGTNNFPEGYLVPERKNHVFRYALYPHAGDWRQGNTHRAGYAFNYPLLARETKCMKGSTLPAELSFVEVEPKNLIVTAMKPFGNPIAAFEKNAVCDAAKGIMLRFYESEGMDAKATVRFASGMNAAWGANLLEEREGHLPLTEEGLTLGVPAFSIETVGFEPKPLGQGRGKTTLGVEAEPVQPVWVRSWEHDAESMPMGYGPVVCTLSRQVRETDGGKKLHIKVNTVNDYTDALVDGRLDLLVPEGWKVTPAGIDFHLDPLGHEIFDVVVTRPNAKASGQIKLRYEEDGQTFQDVLEIGQAFHLDMNVANTGDAIVVTVSNPTAETIEGEVALVTPLETWSKDLVGDYALLDISPRTQGFSLTPGATVNLTYTVRAEVDREFSGPDAYWGVVKLMSNGRIVLKRCDHRPERVFWTASKWHELNDERARKYFESLKKG